MIATLLVRNHVAIANHDLVVFGILQHTLAADEVIESQSLVGLSVAGPLAPVRVMSQSLLAVQLAEGIDIASLELFLERRIGIVTKIADKHSGALGQVTRWPFRNASRNKCG